MAQTVDAVSTGIVWILLASTVKARTEGGRQPRSAAQTRCTAGQRRRGHVQQPEHGLIGGYSHIQLIDDLPCLYTTLTRHGAAQGASAAAQGGSAVSVHLGRLQAPVGVPRDTWAFRPGPGPDRLFYKAHMGPGRAGRPHAGRSRRMQDIHARRVYSAPRASWPREDSHRACGTLPPLHLGAH